MVGHPLDRPEPRHSIESEQGLLGAILVHPEALDRVRGLIEPEDFIEPLHSRLYEVMCQRRDSGESIDTKLVTMTIGDQDLGGKTVREYLGDLLSGASPVASAADHAKVVRRAAQLRHMMAAAYDLVDGATSANLAFDPTSIASAAIEALDAVASAGLAEHLRRVTLGEAAGTVVRNAEEARAGKAKRGATYGLPSLDRVTLGMRPDQFIVLCGRPGMGKTTLGVHIGLAVARAGMAVGFMSLEMGSDELAERVLASLVYDPSDAPITYRDIREGSELTDHSMRRLEEAEQYCRRLPLWIERQPGLTVSQIAARARQMKLKADRARIPLGAVIVDHIGLVQASSRYQGNRVQEVSEISAALKRLAKELGVPVVGLSQLSREVERRPEKRPVLSDLRDSGSIEQDADVVLSVYREAYYLEHKENKSPEEIALLREMRDVIEVEVLKQRQGPTVRLRCFCDIACNVVGELAR